MNSEDAVAGKVVRLILGAAVAMVGASDRVGIGKECTLDRMEKRRWERIRRGPTIEPMTRSA
jgi:hypothetical protein